MLHVLASAIHKEELNLPFQLPEEFVENHQCVAVLTGGSEALFLRLVDEGKVSLKEPIFIIASGYSNSLAASLEILAWIQQHKGSGRVVTSPEQINNSVLKRTNLRLGVVGEPSDWLIASKVDDAYIYEQTGIRMVHIPIEEVSSLGEVDGGMAGAEQIYQRLKEIVARYNLNGLTLRCFDLLTTVKNTGCIALSHLNDEGIPASCEGDVPLLLTMILAKQKYGQIGFQVNPARIGDDGKMLFAHCTIPLKMTTSHVFDTHFESGIGVGIHGELPLGKYRLMKLSTDLTQLVDEPVELVANQYEQNLCRTQVWLQATPKLAHQLLTQPLQNHHLLIREV
jgi:L-fucose isomerase-like protein